VNGSAGDDKFEVEGSVGNLFIGAGNNDVKISKGAKVQGRVGTAGEAVDATAYNQFLVDGFVYDGVYGNDGIDKIVIASDGLVYMVQGGKGNDIIEIDGSAGPVSGGSGNDAISVKGRADAVYASVDADVVHIHSDAFVPGGVFGDGADCVAPKGVILHDCKTVDITSSISSDDDDDDK